MSNLEEILVKYFENQASEEEKQQVEDFKKAKHEEFLILEKIWTEKRQVKLKSFDTESAWAKVQTQIQSRKTSKVRKLVFRRNIAAAILILVSVSFLLWYQFSGEQSPQYLTATGQDKTITLEDGTKIWLNKNAKLEYAESFSNLKERKVKLSGEAFFEVARNPKKPFIIETKQANIKVLGTSFNVKSSKTSAEVNVATGLVEVSSNQNQEKVQLKPNYSAKVNNYQIQKVKSKPNFQSWRTGKFVFKNVPIKQAIRELNTYYDNQISLEDINAECRLTIAFSKEKLETVKETLTLICN